MPATRSSGKSDNAFRTISEVADTLEVPQHVLRFWETKFAQVRPLKRGGGRRYYRPEDVELLRRIRDLLYHEGYTIKGVQRLLREGGARNEPPLEDLELQDEQPPCSGSLPLAGRHRREIEAVLHELVALRDLLRERKN